jgi:LmeA-like phospholipid-binding
MGEPIDAATPANATPADATPAKGLISRVLAPAIQLWLKSQVEQVEHLQVGIQARDRQILSGTIPQITLLAQKVIYQGLHLSDVDLTGRNIRVNLGQVIQGKPLQLLEPIAVNGMVILLEADLNASLAAPLLADAIKLFLLDLLRSGSLEAVVGGDLNLQNLQMRLMPTALTLRADLISQTGQATEIALRSGLHLSQPNQLQLQNPQWLPHFNAKRGLPLKELDGYEFDLGDAQLTALTITQGQLECHGQLLVQP